VKFPEARIELNNDLLITTDENDTLSRSGIYAIVGGIFGGFLALMLEWSLMNTCMLIFFSAAGVFFFRRWYIQRKRVRMENIEFEKYFDVKCDDQI
jgi:hypothetical protein